MVLLTPTFWFWMAVVPAILFFLPAFFWRQASVIKVLRVISLGFVTLGLLFAAQWAWLLRDGMVPGSAASSGVTAATHFLTLFWLPFVVIISVAALILGLSRRWLARL